jgi:hypothetical protein
MLQTRLYCMHGCMSTMHTHELRRLAIRRGWGPWHHHWSDYARGAWLGAYHPMRLH